MDENEIVAGEETPVQNQDAGNSDSGPVESPVNQTGSVNDSNEVSSSTPSPVEEFISDDALLDNAVAGPYETTTEGQSEHHDELTWWDNFVLDLKEKISNFFKGLRSLFIDPKKLLIIAGIAAIIIVVIAVIC